MSLPLGRCLDDHLSFGRMWRQLPGEPLHEVHPELFDRLDDAVNGPLLALRFWQQQAWQLTVRKALGSHTMLLLSGTWPALPDGLYGTPRYALLISKTFSPINASTGGLYSVVYL